LLRNERTIEAIIVLKHLNDLGLSIIILGFHYLRL
jgi:hypothetical protein